MRLINMMRNRRLVPLKQPADRTLGHPPHHRLRRVLHGELREALVVGFYVGGRGVADAVGVFGVGVVVVVVVVGGGGDVALPVCYLRAGGGGVAVGSGVLLLLLLLLLLLMLLLRG